MSDSPKAIRYLALGDSYTIGESVSESERWPEQLAQAIQACPHYDSQNGGIEGGHVDLTLIARTGWTTDELWSGIQAQTINPPYDLVSLLIGVNNQYRGRDLDEYRAQFHFLLNKAIEHAGDVANRVIVVSIPDWGVTPFAQNDKRSPEQIASEIDAFNAVNQDEANKAGAHYVDITPYSRHAKEDLSLIAEDGLHPSGKMYTGWVEIILPVALHLLR